MSGYTNADVVKIIESGAAICRRLQRIYFPEKTYGSVQKEVQNLFAILKMSGKKRALDLNHEGLSGSEVQYLTNLIQLTDDGYVELIEEVGNVAAKQAMHGSSLVANESPLRG